LSRPPPRCGPVVTSLFEQSFARRRWGKPLISLLSFPPALSTDFPHARPFCVFFPLPLMTAVHNTPHSAKFSGVVPFCFDGASFSRQWRLQSLPILLTLFSPVRDRRLLRSHLVSAFRAVVVLLLFSSLHRLFGVTGPELGRLLQHAVRTFSCPTLVATRRPAFRPLSPHLEIICLRCLLLPSSFDYQFLLVSVRNGPFHNTQTSPHLHSGERSYLFPHRGDWSGFDLSAGTVSLSKLTEFW